MMKSQISNLKTQNFREWPIFGHTKAMEILQRQIQNKVLNHAYLFSGPAQIGKFRLAKIFAQTILCEKQNSYPCQKCSSCQKITKNIHPDLIIVQPERAQKTAKTNISINQVREVIRKLNLTSHSSLYKLAIFNEAHFLSPESSAALLKTLEEPPKNSIIILITDQEKRLLTTLVSRLQKISLKNLTLEQIKTVLQKRGVQPKKAEILAQISGGKIGQALEFLEKQNFQKYLESINQLCQVVNRDSFLKLKLADSLASDLDNLSQVLTWWIYFFRNVMRAKLNIQKNSSNFNQMKYFDRFKLKKINQFLKNIIQTQKLLLQNANSKLLLENLLLKL